MGQRRDATFLFSAGSDFCPVFFGFIGESVVSVFFEELVELFVCFRLVTEFFGADTSVIAGKADGPAIPHDPVCFSAVDGVFDRFARNDLSVFFKVVVAAAELFQRAVVERFLIVENELLPVVRGQCREKNIVQFYSFFLR